MGYAPPPPVFSCVFRCKSGRAVELASSPLTGSGTLTADYCPLGVCEVKSLFSVVNDEDYENSEHNTFVE